MAKILKLHFPEGRIIDLTFGHGVFYKLGGRERVTGVDIRPTGDVVADSTNLPYGNNEFDIAVVDPPYKRGNNRYEHRYGIAPKTETQVTRLYEAMIKEAFRVAANGVIIKLQDGTDGHRFHARGYQISGFVKEMTGLEPFDICYNIRKDVPSSMVQGEPHFFKNAVSVWLIYKFTKDPYRPVRF